MNFAKFTGKHQCQSLLYDKVADMKSAILFKKDYGRGVFLWILWNISEQLIKRTPPNDCFWTCSLKCCLEGDKSTFPANWADLQHKMHFFGCVTGIALR